MTRWISILQTKRQVSAIRCKTTIVFQHNRVRKYKEDAIVLSMDVDTQPVAANREIIFLELEQSFFDALGMDSLIAAITKNLVETKQNAILKNHAH